jgi:hypothetical protein
MPLTNYTVAPDLKISVRTKNIPKLLTSLFGPETQNDGAELLLDLTGRDEATEPRASLESTARGVYKAVPWSCSLSRSTDGRLTLGFTSLAMREYLAMHIALLPALRLFLTKRGIALISGAAFAKDGVTTILAGPTGTGKTSLLLGALQRGAQFAGDEYVGLSSDGAVSLIIRSLALRSATLALAPDAVDRLSRSRRLALRSAELISNITRARLEPLSHLRPEELGLQVATEAANARRIVWLEAVDGDQSATLQPMPTEDIVQNLALRQAVHQVAYGDITPFLETLAGCEDATARWRQVLSDGLADVECVRLTFARNELPKALDLLSAGASL